MEDLTINNLFGNKERIVLYHVGKKAKLIIRLEYLISLFNYYKLGPLTADVLYIALDFLPACRLILLANGS